MSTPQPVTPSQIQVRQVTHYQFSYAQGEPGGSGTWTLQLILSEGAEEFILSPSADDVDVLQDLFDVGEAPAYFDLERKVLMFGVQKVGEHDHDHH